MTFFLTPSSPHHKQCCILAKVGGDSVILIETGVHLIIIRELKHARFWDANGNLKWAVFPLNLFLHNHIYIAKYLFFIRDD